jgi:protein gp37
MSNKTGIAWTDETANWIVGCTKISSGCAKCYAATAANSPRLQQFDQYKGVVDGNGNWNGEIAFVPKVLEQLLRSKKQRRVFAPSMSDLFHPGVKDEWLDQFFATVALTPHITYQLLTKRPERMLEYFDRLEPNKSKMSPRHLLIAAGVPWPLKNMWLGVTAENQAAADERIPFILQTPAAVRFLSVEPMLEN